MGAFEEGKDFRLSVPAQLEELEAVRSFFFENILVPASLKKKLCLAAEEIFVNICSYAYGQKQGSVDISMRISDRICVEFSDSGEEFHPLENMVDVDGYDIDTQVGGLGRLLAVGLADHAEYTYRDGRNILTLIFHKEEPK